MDQHYKKTLSIDTNDKFVRVTEGDFENNYGYHQFISHSSLTSSTTNHSQHLCSIITNYKHFVIDNVVQASCTCVRVSPFLIILLS